MPTNTLTVLPSVHKKTREKDHHQIIAGNTTTFSFYLKRNTSSFPKGQFRMSQDKTMQ